jgi:hypothetical protein
LVRAISAVKFRTFDCVQADIATRAGLGSANDISRFVCDSFAVCRMLEGLHQSPRTADRDFVENIAKVTSGIRASCPLNAAGPLKSNGRTWSGVEAIKIVLCCDRLRSSRLEVDNPARLPTFDEAAQNAMTASGQTPARTNR